VIRPTFIGRILAARDAVQQHSIAARALSTQQIEAYVV
jgi:hypothetical protein